MYELTASVKSFAIANDFVTITNKACYALGSQLTPFCIYANENQKQYGVLDVAGFDGLLNEGKTLVEEIVEERLKAYKLAGINIDASHEKLLVFDYLLSSSACYVEVPKYVTKVGQAQQSYDKFLCTKNPAVMGAWMGMFPAEMQAKFGTRVSANQLEFHDDKLRFAKLQNSAKGNSISIPRTAYYVENMRCIPLYMLYAFIEGMKPHLERGILTFEFEKDNGQIRELSSTLSQDVLRDYYKDNNVIASMLAGVDVNTVKQGGMMLASKMHRGYIKIPELGSSIYDDTGVRSLNVARLLSIKQVESVSREFIHVDLNSVVSNFNECMDYMLKNMPDQISQVAVALAGKDTEGVLTSEPAGVVEKLKMWVQTRDAFLSTTYRRHLHRFMIRHPEWFPHYTGLPNTSITSNSYEGAVPLDF